MSGELVGQITNGLVEPQGLFVDASRNLWVANFNNVLVYPRGGLSPSATLMDSVGYPVDVTVCPNGTAYVADFYNYSNSNVASIQVYPPGNTSPSATLNYSSDFRNPFLTCDAAGNVFAAILTGDSVGDGRVIEFPLGQQRGVKDLGIVLQSPGGIKPDNAGNLLVTDLIGHTITEYAESGSPTGTFDRNRQPDRRHRDEPRRQDGARGQSEWSRWNHVVLPRGQAKTRVHVLLADRSATPKRLRRCLRSRSKGHLTHRTE